MKTADRDTAPLSLALALWLLAAAGGWHALRGGEAAQPDRSTAGGWKASPALSEDLSRRSPGTIYLEEKVPAYTLPDPLASADGTKVETAAQWKENRRGEILELFRKHVYGRAPSRPEGLSFEVVDKEAKALDGSATRKQVIVRFAAGRDEPAMEVLIYIPNGRRRPVPAFLGLNFQGNHSVHPDPGIRLGRSWMRPGRDGVVDNRATEKSRGAARSRWPIEKILARGYGVATVYYGDIDPDFHDEFRNGVHPLFDDRSLERRPPDAWGSIAAWAWGLSRALDYLETDSDIDGRRIAVLGHSRLGKTALWAGASDERFALVISNNSGCGGAALSRRCFGETVERINRSFPHWFCENFKRYNGRESELPIDQHMLVALMAPRPVYIASADQDLWADPRGEFLSALHASPVYRLLGLEGLPAKEMPPLDRSVQGTIGYHVRSGGHDVKDYDWERYMDFADRHLRAR